ncbi:MAG: SPASM domain-containing protein [Methylacidiphilales bacterium]|nr:SPASM domain-containing protein [Candidatus Methylacidiphilales bacterium]
MFLSGKATPLRIWNAVACFLSYFLKRSISAKSPLLINFELWNECNESCVFCRSETNVIYDTNPHASGALIPKGKLPLEVYQKVLDEVGDRLMMAIPYVNGEPLMSRDIYAAIKYAADKRILTLIASNGILLNEINSRRLLAAGLDCLKVQISGFTQPIHSIEHRRGDVELIKRNIQTFVRLRREMGKKTILVLDYIRYRHNEHELELAREFARQNDILFNIRPGNPHGLEGEPPQLNGPLPTDLPCDWLWTILTVDWNGAVYPCCNYVVWSDGKPYGTAGKDMIRELWNGSMAQRMRNVHTKHGRTPIPICAKCPQQGVKFKW